MVLKDGQEGETILSGEMAPIPPNCTCTLFVCLLLPSLTLAGSLRSEEATTNERMSYMCWV